MKKILFTALILLSGQNCMAQYQLDTLIYAGDSNIFTDIVFLGDGFTEGEMDSFEAYAKDHTNQFFDKVPWKHYQKMFNVFYVKTPSNESGAGETPDSPIDNIFGTCFGTSGVDRLCWPTKWDKVYEVLNATKPEYDMVVILVNKDKYGGGGSSKFICYSATSSIETLRHEAGHAIGGLADEYWYNGRERPNQTQDIVNLKWSKWVGEENIGTFRYSEDPSQESYSWYRPHQNCLMRYLNREYCAVCREALVESIHNTSKNIISYSPNSDQEQEINDSPVTFSLNLLKPEPNTLKVRWMIDGSGFADNVEKIALQPSKLEKGSHTLSVSVEDTTLYVRTDNHSDLHASVVRWDINVGVSSGLEIVTDATADFTIENLPFDDELTIRSSQQLQLPVKAELTDMSGRKVASGAFDASNYCRLNTSQLPAGVYLLQIIQNNQPIFTHKILKR